MKKIFYFWLVLFIIFPVIGYSQEKFSKTQIDSILNKYVNISTYSNQRERTIKEIDALLPRIDGDSAKLVLITKKSLLYGTNLKDQPLLLKNHLEAKKLIYTLDSSDEDKILIHLGLAETYKYLKMYELSSQNIETAYQLLSKVKKSPENISLTFACHFIDVDALYHMDRYDECIKKANEIIAGAKSLKLPGHEQFAEMIGNQYLGVCYLQKKEYSNAQTYLLKAKKLDVGMLADLSLRNNNAYARLLLETKQVDSALKVLQEFPITKNEVYPEEFSERYSLLSKIFAQKGEVEKFEFYNNKKDSLDKSYKVVEMKAVEEAQKYAEDESVKKINYRNTIIWMLLPILLLGIGSALYFRRKKNIERTKFLSIIENIKKEIASQSEIESSTEEPKTKETTISINEEKEQILLSGLRKFENQLRFRDSNLSLASLAGFLKTNTTYLSEVINKNKGKNFNAYINELRINYITKKLYTCPEYLNYKISYLAEDSGFASHSAFATVFKNVVGISPSVFIQNLREEQN